MRPWLLFIGSSIAAVLLAAKMPAAGAAWPDTLGGFGVACVSMGLALLWLHRRRSDNYPSTAQTSPLDGTYLQGELKELIASLECLQAELAGLQPAQVQQHIEALLARQIWPLNQRLRKLNGSACDGVLQASLIAVLAQGERLLNRIWSAAADGYLEEIALLFPQVCTTFRQAYAIALQRAAPLPSQEQAARPGVRRTS